MEDELLIERTTILDQFARWRRRDYTPSLLLVGPPGAGKGALARGWARVLLCTDPRRDDTTACSCPSCRLWPGHPDFRHSTRAATVADALGETRRFMRGAPLVAERRVILFEEFDGVSTVVVNALLKEIEEPSASTGIVLTARSLLDLPGTIRSRVHVLPVGGIRVESVVELLNARFPDHPMNALIARFCRGLPGQALSYAANAAWCTRQQRFSEVFPQVSGWSLAERLTWGTEIWSESGAVEHFLEASALWWRDVARLASRPEGLVYQEHRPVLQHLAQTTRPSDIVTYLERAAQLATALETLHTRAALLGEALLLDWPSG